MLTDFHSHILPMIDDGSSSVEESVAMLRTEAEQGISRVIATPHYYANHESPLDFIKRRDESESLLLSGISDIDGLPELEIGAEVHYFRGLSESDYLPLLTIRDKCSILIEMPPYPWSDTIITEISDIWYKRGIRPVIAHVDRYLLPFTAKGVFRRLSMMPVLVQANASFFIDSPASRTAIKMLREDRIHLLGSDCHNMNSRMPNMQNAILTIKQKLGNDAITRIKYYEDLILGK